MTLPKQELAAGTGQNMPSSRRETEEDMLELFMELSSRGTTISPGEICKGMDLTRREVSYYLRQMELHGYILPAEKRETITLTELGRITGEEIRYRHEIFTQFLQFVGVGDEKAEEDACRIEHVVSEETVQQICNFVDYGDTFERILRHSELRFIYPNGDYTFLMGIYHMEKTCPRRLAEEFQFFSENIILKIREDESSFRLLRTDTKEPSPLLWYKDPDSGWVQAAEENGNPLIPARVFEFSIRRQDPITEGTALIAFAREGERPAEWNSRELDVHIWKGGM